MSQLARRGGGSPSPAWTGVSAERTSAERWVQRCSRSLEKKWVSRHRGIRGLQITGVGRRELLAQFGLHV
ncbi:MAG TPA: hypothetical protein VIF32_03510 [Gemmatimonadaceae bacterium]